MSKIALNMKDITDLRAATKAKTALDLCTGTQLADPMPPEVGALATALEEFNAAILAQVAADNAAKSATERKKEKRKTVERKYAAVAAKVQTLSEGSSTFIIAHGFDVVSTGRSISMTQVLNLSVSAGDEVGQLDVQWDPVSGVRVYKLQIGTDPTGPSPDWTDKAMVTKSKCSLKSLPTATKVWVRVKAIGAKDEGAWSDPAVKTVP